MSLKHKVFRAGLTSLSVTGLARLAAPLTQGLGAILMFHHVRPPKAAVFQPNKILEITPQFLDAVLTHVKARGYDIIPLDDVPARLGAAQVKPFVALTFDDGYQDNAVHALPVLKRHDAPFTLFATTGFADASAPLWWKDVEHALAKHPERQAAFDQAMARVRINPWERTRDEIAALARAAGIDALAHTREQCLDWEALAALSAEPLCTIGAHTVTHPLLARMDASAMEREILASRDALQDRLGRPVKHLAYPVGDTAAAGAREFAFAKSAGFLTACTTRPGVLFEGHAEHLHALPRLSVNGLYQSIRDFDVLLTGAAFALFNRGRRINCD